MRLTLAQIAESLTAYGDIDQGGSVEVTGVHTDSRTIRPGDLFICLTGEKFDGHGFAAEAAKAGAVAVVAHTPIEDPGIPVLMVRDTLQALGQLASYVRMHCGATVAAVTGSAGKTTVKELLWSILSQRFRTAKNQRNFNNQVGLPLTILQCQGEEDIWVLELGISHPGDMDDLGVIARPDLAIIHNIGSAHTEGLGGLKGVAQAKASLLRFLRPGGRAVINADYPELVAEASQYTNNIVYFSCLRADMPFACSYLGRDNNGMGSFVLRLDGEAMELALPLFGQHMAEDICAAATAAHLLGADSEAIRLGLSNPPVVPGRFDRHDLGGLELIDDAYNANPLSMRSSIAAAAELAGDRPMGLVLGDMLELGDGEHQEHEEIGRFIAQTRADAKVFYKGRFIDDIRRGLEEEGFAGSLSRIRDPQDFINQWEAAKGGPMSEGVVLFKGSRSMHMDAMHLALVKALRNLEAGGTD
ncbi:MAG: UDP-N-acetylmuramoyl-tripeptide--D-alanyl-D-alanine ligase [Desulfovibrio sp.]|uniref:UDP-N-acetylmuramoyl-tripeptide--D-alanyl-D- alanine ligase n=1 Tax=Desulfovibrio sp. 7SRBS1 TaxID=3378064 RepID=UPI003B3EA6ED